MYPIKTTGGFKIMSIGRVQGPTLNLIVQKEKEIQNFKSEKYFQSFITVDDKKNQLELKYHKDIFDKKELEKLKNLIGKEAIATTKKTESFLPPNPPFNLTNLQTEAYQLYGITPSNTLKAAQSLYLAGLISYPRTSSQKLPSSIDYQKILDILKIRYKVAKLITKDKPIEGKKTDPAHPSIYPTGNNQVLSGNEEKIYNLIVKRFLSLFCDDAIIDRKKIEAKINDLSFSTHGSAIRKKAWLEIYRSELMNANVKQREQQKKENILAPCPVCKKGNLAITYSKKTRRHFIACDAYPDCKTTYSLPPRGNIQKTEKICEECKFPILMALTTGKKPWFFCFNKECPTNKKRLEEYYQKKEEAEKESA